MGQNGWFKNPTPTPPHFTQCVVITSRLLWPLTMFPQTPFQMFRFREPDNNSQEVSGALRPQSHCWKEIVARILHRWRCPSESNIHRHFAEMFNKALPERSTCIPGMAVKAKKNAQLPFIFWQRKFGHWEFYTTWQQHPVHPCRKMVGWCWRM